LRTILVAVPALSLVEPASGRFLIQAGDVQYSVSATLAVALSRGRDRRVRRRGFVGVGDPVYDWAAFRRGEPERGELEAMAASRGFDLWRRAVDERESGVERLGLTRLPGTARELQDIARLFGARARIYLRGDATEDLVKSGALSGYRIVHIASHGLLTPHYQALALSLNPASAEDGFLMSSEIAGLSLDADLVVLSACRSGDTRSRLAEPVAGMALGLRSAGARSVLLSLWNVDDEATAALMVRFYRPLVKSTHTYVRSLARAKRAMIAAQDDQSHPYYCAPFILHGP